MLICDSGLFIAQTRLQDAFAGARVALVLQAKLRAPLPLGPHLGVGVVPAGLPHHTTIIFSRHRVLVEIDSRSGTELRSTRIEVEVKGA